MRVVVSSFDPVPAAKGASQHILSTVDILRRDHDVSLVTLGEQPAPGIRHLPLRFDEPNWLRRAMLFSEQCDAIFRRERFDAHHVRSPFEGLRAPVSSALIAEINGLYSIETPYHYPGLTGQPSVRTLLRNQELALLDRADRIITPSPVTASYLSDLGADPARIRIVPNRPSFAPQPNTSARDGTVRCVYHGTLSPWQGLLPLISLLPRLRDLDWTLAIYTPTRRRKPIERAIRKTGLGGRVTVHNPVPVARLGDLLASFDLGISPLTPCERNLVQGCHPIKILDQMAASLPILAPDIPVVRGMLGDDYPLYRAWSRTGLVEVLRGWITEPSERARWGQTGRERVAAFSAARQAADLRAVYTTL